MNLRWTVNLTVKENKGKHKGEVWTLPIPPRIWQGFKSFEHVLNIRWNCERIATKVSLRCILSSYLRGLFPDTKYLLIWLPCQTICSDSPIFSLWKESGFSPSTAIISDTRPNDTFETKVVTCFTKRLISTICEQSTLLPWPSLG